MSKVSVKNDMWPSFQPIDQTQNSQKRKRTSATTFKDTGNENPVSNKRSRGKRNVITATSAAAVAPLSVTITNSVVWIGAILMQEEEEKSVENEEVSSISAAFSIFYGLNDSRNITEKVSIKQNQNIDHVYIMGIIRVLEKYEDDSSALSIHTGSKELLYVLDEAKQDKESICDQIKEKIAKRKGTTSIHSATKKEDEFQAAHKLASEKLFEADTETSAMEIDVTEKSLVDSLEVAECKEDISVTTTATSTVEVKLNNDNTEKIATKTTIVEEESITTILADEDKQALASPPSWAATLNIRNLLDILKAPFTRNK